MKSGLFIMVGVLLFGCAGSVSQITGEQEVATVAQAKPGKIKPEKKQVSVPVKPAVNNKANKVAVNNKNNAVAPVGQANPAMSFDSGKEVVQQAVTAAANDLNRADSILATDSRSPVVEYNRAIVKYRLGKYADAFRLARAAVGDMKAPDACLGVVFDAGIAGRDFSGLSNFLSGYAANHPKSIVAANLVARVLIFQGRPSEAVRRAKQVLKRAETNIDVMKTIAMAYMTMKRYDAARFVIVQIREIKADDPDSMDMMGHILVNTGKKRVAIAMFADTVKAAPGMYDAWVNLGLLNMDAGDYDDAEKQFRTAIKLMPGRVDAYIDLGTVLTKVVRFADARKVLNKALEVSPGNPLVYFNLGVIELSDKPADMDRPEHYRKAIVWFKKYQENTKFLPSSDPVYKYMDEASRMARQQELIMQQMQQTPKEPAKPTPKPKAVPKPATSGIPTKTAPKPAPVPQGSGQTNTGGKK